jgi:transposase
MDTPWGVAPEDCSFERLYRNWLRHHGGRSFQAGGRDVSNQQWFVGVDWATEEHVVCVIDDAGKLVGERAFRHSGEGLAMMCTWILEKSAAAPEAVHVAIEVPHGPVVETLLERSMLVYAINPKQLDRFRDRFTVAGAKDDRRDARVLADSLRTDAKCFRLLQASDPTVVQLREWSRITEELTHDRVMLTNRLREQLLRYYPQMLELADHDIGASWFLELWRLAPTPEAALKVREKAVTRLLTDRRIRRFDAKHVLSTLRQQPLVVAPGAVAAAAAHIGSLAERVELLNRQLKTAHGHLDRLTNELAARESEPGQKGEQRDVDILRSLPGVGRMVLATLLAEAWEPLVRRDYHALRTLCGVAPVTVSSGKMRGKRAVVGMRRACHMRLRNALYHWARIATQHDPRSRADYAAMRARGHTHARSLRSIGDRLLALACAMLRDQTAYDLERRQAA